MRFRRLLFTVIAFAVSTATSQAQTAAKQVMIPGLWEITVQTVSPIKGLPITQTVCIDKAHSTRPSPPKSSASDDCQVSPDATAANETAYTVRCAKRKTTSSARFTYAGDHYDGTVTIVTADAEIHQVHTAKRVGACDEPLPDTPVTTTAQGLE
jgi:hypothetical protein